MLEVVMTLLCPSAAMQLVSFVGQDSAEKGKKMCLEKNIILKYVVKHKSAKLFMTYAVGKLEAALNISHSILSTSVRVS